MYSSAYVWAKVIAYLEERLTPAIVSTWFEQAYIVDYNDTSMTICAPSQFCKEQIERRCDGYIRDAMRDLFSQEVQIKVVTDEEVEELRVEEQKKQAAPRFNPSYTFESFVVGASNRYAYNAALAVTDNPAGAYNPLFIYGQSGLGKTHLLYAIANKLQSRFPDYNIVLVNSETFTNELISYVRDQKGFEFRRKYRNADLFLMDDVQFIGGKTATEEEFFHTFNELYENKKQIVLTSDKPPQDIPVLTDRLRTRFGGGLICDISLPDYEMRMAIIQNKAEAVGMKLSNDVCNYIAENITNNIRHLEGTVKRISFYHDLGMPLDLPNVSRAIKDMFKGGANVPTPALIISEVSRFYGVEENVLRSRLKSNNIVLPRQVAMYLIRKLTGLSMPDIGKEFGRDHTTVLSALRKIESQIKKDAALERALKDISENVNAKV